MKGFVQAADVEPLELRIADHRLCDLVGCRQAGAVTRLAAKCARSKNATPNIVCRGAESIGGKRLRAAGV